jgi:parvulin-like peptidyl-prolyl isomerase
LKRTFSLVLPVLAFVVLLTAACGGGGSSSSSSSQNVPANDVAVVGGQAISRTSLDQLLAQAKRGYAAQKQKFPKAGTAAFKSLQDRMITSLVQRAEFEQRAKSLGVTVSDKQVDTKINDVKAKQFGGSEPKLVQALKAQGATLSDYRDYIKQTLLSQAVYTKITKGVTVTDAEVKQYYAQHKSQYTQPESRDVRHILVKTQSLANKLYAQLQSGASFPALVKKYTTDPGSKSTGGKYTDTKGSFDPTFEKTAFSLRTNEISKPIHTRFGWHIIQALSPIRPQKTTPFSQLKTSIKQQLLNQKKSTVANQWVSDMTKEFCKGKIAYQQGYRPLIDPCQTATTSSPTTTG